MKIVTTYLNPKYSGIVNALQSIAGEVILWKSDSVPVFDFFYYTKPDLLLVDVDVADSNFISAISELKDFKLILFGNSVPSGLNPEVICTEPSISQLMKKHLELDYKVVYVHDYVDIINYIGGDKDERLSSDVGTMFSNENLSIELLEFLLYISSISNMKIIGNNNLSIPNFLGNMPHKRKLDFMKSSKIFLDINSSLLLEAAANGVFTFSTVPNSLFPSVDIQNFEDQYNEFIKNKDKRIDIASKARIEVLGSGTNFHRLIDIFNLLDIENKDEYISKSNQKIEEALK